MKSVEIIQNSDGSFSLLVYGQVILTGTREQCEERAAVE
jgi:hypothetical protein